MPDEQKTAEQLAEEAAAAKKDDVAAILEDLKLKLDEKKEPPAPQPAASSDRRKAFMEANKVTEATMQALESGTITEQRLAIMELKASNKDWDVLEKPFLKEVEKYNREHFRVVDSSVAGDLFMAVKGREITAGRYKLPDSQPSKGPKKESDSSVISSRIAGNFNPGDGGMGGDDKQPAGADSLTDREKLWASIVDVEPEAYAKEKAKKRAGIKAIADKAFIRPDKIVAGNSADFSLNELQRKHGVRV